MRNMACVIWLLGYPLVLVLETFVYQYLLNQMHSDAENALMGLFVIATWFVVALFLYEKKRW